MEDLLQSKRTTLPDDKFRKRNIQQHFPEIFCVFFSIQFLGDLILEERSIGPVSLEDPKRHCTKHMIFKQ